MGRMALELDWDAVSGDDGLCEGTEAPDGWVTRAPTPAPERPQMPDREPAPHDSA